MHTIEIHGVTYKIIYVSQCSRLGTVTIKQEVDNLTKDASIIFKYEYVPTALLPADETRYLHEN